MQYSETMSFLIKLMITNSGFELNCNNKNDIKFKSLKIYLFISPACEKEVKLTECNFDFVDRGDLALDQNFCFYYLYQTGIMCNQVLYKLYELKSVYF